MTATTNKNTTTMNSKVSAPDWRGRGLFNMPGLL